MRIIAALVIAGGFASLGFTACGRGETETEETDPPVEDDPPTEEQSAAADTTNEGVTAIGLGLAFSDILFNFDPDLDPNATDGENTAKIEENAMMDSGGCATITGTGDTGITIDFGSGCTFGSLEVSGAVTVTLAITGGEGSERTVTVGLDMQALVIQGLSFDGTASFETTNGFRLGVDLDLTVGQTTLVAALDVLGAPGFFTMDGTASVDGSPELRLEGVKVSKGACWAEAGSIATTVAGADVSLAFDADTPQTGQATLTYPTPRGEATACYVLNNHGTCVATPCPSEI